MAKHIIDMRGKVALITGGSRGLGKAMALGFAEAGADVVIAGRRLAACEEVAGLVAQRGRQALAYACHVGRWQECDALADAAYARFGRVDVLINNAGKSPLYDRPVDISEQLYDSVFDVNLKGPFRLSAVVGQRMVDAGRGAIINISSVAGHIPVPYKAAYSATKFALNAIGKAARVELNGTGVTILTVCPGYIATNFSKNVVRGQVRRRLGGAVRRGATPDLIARATLDGYLKGKREIVAPWRDGLVVKLYQIWPGAIEWAMRRIVQEGDDMTVEPTAAKS